MDTPSNSSAGAEISLLGPLELVVDGVAVPAGGPRQRALLALLALSAGTAVSAARLIDLLWGATPPPAAANTVQVYVSRLRRLMAGETGISPLRTVAGSYLLDLPPEAIDTRRFELLSEAGRAHLAAGETVAAAQELRSALALWRGAALPDLADTTVAQAAVARLESIRLATLADRIDADALLGRHATLVPELEGLVLRHPLDERFVGQLMTALYRSGRQAEAFAVYGSAAARLADELGINPGPALRSLHSQVLHQDVELDSPQQRQSGPRRVPEPGQPAQGRLVGRKAELAAALELIRQPQVRLLTLVGPGGAGKTRLAEEIVAVRAADADADADADVRPVLVVFVPLAAVTDAAELPLEICRALGAEPDWAGEPPVEVAARALEGGPALIVLDNMEQLVGAKLRAVTELLELAGQLTVLATSRSVLRLPGERLLAVGPLPLPVAGPDGGDEVGSVLAADSVQLFRERARAVLPSFEVTAVNAIAVAALCRSLDGLPLALELAAARVRVLPPEEILSRLDRRMELLAGGAAHLPERQRSMWAALDWSAQLLNPVELLLFGQLSVFVGGWTLDAAEYVAGSAAVVDVLGRLADKSLVVADGTGRFGMLETVRDYARDLLRADAPGEAIVRDRHAGYFANLAEELGPQSRGWLSASGVSPRARLDREAANLVAALEHAEAVAARGGEPLGRLVAGLLDYWFAAGRLMEADRWIQGAREAALTPALRARLLLSLGNLAVVGGDLVTASAALKEAYEIAQQFGDSELVVRASAARAVVVRYMGEPERALTFLNGALVALSKGPAGIDRSAIEKALENELGEVLDELGRTDEAIDLWRQCQHWAAADDNFGQLAYPLVNLARCALDRGDAANAQALMDEALAAAVANDSTPVLADVVAAAGLLDHRTGNAARAAARLRQAVRLGHDCGQLLSWPEVVSLLGAALVRDDPAVANRLLSAAVRWQADRSIVSSRPARAVVAEAEALLLADAADGSGDLLTPERVRAERERGARTTFGSLRGLLMLDPGLRPDPGLVDLTGDLTGADAGSVIDLRPRVRRR